MRSHRLAPKLAGLFLTATALGTACDEPVAPLEPETGPVSSRPLLSEGPPEQSGTVVFRMANDDYLFIHPLFPDRRSGLWSLHSSVDFGSLCRGQGLNVLPVREQIVDVQSTEEVIKRLGSAPDLYTAVGTESFLTIATCSDLFERLLADGTATWQNTDNDLFASGTRTNAFGHTMQGILDLVGGGQARYYEVSRVSVGDDQSNDDLRHGNIVYQISLEPLD
jgi:hypothetical protein